jgi:hypothetical protein
MEAERPFHEAVWVAERNGKLTDEQWCATMCGDYHHEDCPIGVALRDCWNTPQWLTDILPRVTLDPCSNIYSTVIASKHVVWEGDDERWKTGAREGFVVGDGLAVSWKNRSVFVNPPYSAIMPWARKAGEAKAFIFLVNNVTTTKWYRELVRNGGVYKFEFSKRLKFSPPPRIRQSSNSRDQVLICNQAGWMMIGESLNEHGRWWTELGGYQK